MESFVRNVRVPSARGTGRGERRRVAALHAGSSDDGAQERRSVAEKREGKRGGSGAGAALFCGEARRLRCRRGSLLRRSVAAPARTRLSSAEKRGGSDAGATLFCEGVRRLRRGRGSFFAKGRGGSSMGAVLFCGEARRLRRGHGSFFAKGAAAPAWARLFSAKGRGGSSMGAVLFCGEARWFRRGRGSFLRRSTVVPARTRLLLRRSAAGQVLEGAGTALFLRRVGCEERRGGNLSVRRSSAGGYSVTVSPAGRETRWLFQTASPPSWLARTVSLPSFREISTCPSGRGSVPSKESVADASGATTKVA